MSSHNEASAATTVAAAAQLIDPNCPICLEILREPYEKGCGHLVCYSCISNLYDMQCPVCRESRGVWSRNNYMCRIIDNIPYECPDGCGESVTHRTRRQHEIKCCRRLRCVFHDCEYLGSWNSIAMHLVSDHNIRADISTDLNQELHERMSDLNLDATSLQHIVNAVETIIEPRMGVLLRRSQALELSESAVPPLVRRAQRTTAIN